jgi:serine phosphatase RsbU (regulator of sigma subunit)
MCLLWNELGDVPCLEVALQAEDRLVFYTDGITERQAVDDTMYDPDRLARALAQVSTAAAPTIVEHVVADLDAFARGLEPDDDQTIVVAALNGAV